MALEIEIRELPKLPNANMYSHWRSRHRDAVKWKNLVRNECDELCRLNARIASAIPFKCARVTLTRYSSREPDRDNLMFSWKHCIDGLVLAGVIADDTPAVIGTPISQWEYAKKRIDQRIRIRVEAIEEVKEIA
jgi:Holliday junction resolvase RusA-like endonuclease